MKKVKLVTSNVEGQGKKSNYIPIVDLVEILNGRARVENQEEGFQTNEQPLAVGGKVPAHQSMIYSNEYIYNAICDIANDLGWKFAPMVEQILLLFLRQSVKDVGIDKEKRDNLKEVIEFIDKQHALVGRQDWHTE